MKRLLTLNPQLQIWGYRCSGTEIALFLAILTTDITQHFEKVVPMVHM